MLWEKKLVELSEAFERLCRTCGRVEELDRVSEETRASTVQILPGRNHLHKTLNKHEILDAVNTD